MVGYGELAKIVFAHIGCWLHDYGFELNSREWASLIWLGILLAFGLSKPTVRKCLRDFLRSAFSPKLAAVWAIYVAWIAGFVALAHWVGVWKNVLTKDTIVWTVTAGLALIVTFTEASKPGHFGRAVLKAVCIVVLLEYLVTLAKFRLWVELMLQPIVVLFVVAPIVVKEPGLRTSWHRASTWFFGILTFVMVGHTARTLYDSWTTMDWGLFALRAIWPMVMAFWVLIVVFGLAVVASYEQAFLRFDPSRDENVGALKPKLGLLLALRLQLRWIHEAAKGGTFHVARSHSVRSAFQAARSFKAERIAEKRREDAYQAELIRYAGSAALDEKGRPRDKREFRETVRALEWLHTCQMGWYRRKPVGYKPDLIERFGDDFTAQSLPIPSGITMVVSDDGQHWYAWRRTPGGHHFAIGASEEPPNQWLYDGSDPPRDFPGIAAEWGDTPFSEERAPNWYGYANR